MKNPFSASSDDVLLPDDELSPLLLDEPVLDDDLTSRPCPESVAETPLFSIGELPPVRDEFMETSEFRSPEVEDSAPSQSGFELLSSPSAPHHQPTDYAAPMGWSAADFEGHDGSELPQLSMEEKSCRMCKYFHYAEGTRSTVRFGECRCKAPVNAGKAAWPSVLWESWCGEWQMGVSQEEIMQMARTIADGVSIEAD